MNKTWILIISVSVATFALIGSEKSPEVAAQQIAEENAANQLIMDQIKSAIQFYDEQIDEIIKQANDINETLRKISEIQAAIKKVKDQYNITGIENQLKQLKIQLDSLAVGLYNKAIDPKDKINFFKKINALIDQINSDPVVRENMKRMKDWESEAIVRIRKPVSEIEKIGRKIDLFTQGKEQKQVDQVYMQLYPLRAQLINARLQKKPNEELTPLENEIIKQQNAIQDKILTLSSDQRIAIRNYREAIKRLNLLLDYIREPRKAATATEEQIALFETP